MRAYSVFDEEPKCGWGSHSDAFLWNVIRGYFLFEDYASAETFEAAVRRTYKSLLGKELADGEEYHHVTLKHKSLSMALCASTEWWNEKAIPILKERFEMAEGDCTDKRFRITVITSDIASRTEHVIVNPTNKFLKPGTGGVCAAIHRKAGPELERECRKIPADKDGVRCPVGSMQETDAGNLNCKKVFHVVPPNCQRGTREEGDKLRDLYVAIWSRMHDKKYPSIALPSIGTGKMGYPVAEAAKVAAPLMLRICQCNPDIKVVICCAKNEDVECYKNAIREVVGKLT